MDPFDAVVGQEHAVAALRSQLATTGGAGSTLIVGPEGVGRFLLARCVADAILGPAVRADLTILEPGAGIDGVREVRATLARKPAEGPRQVLILRDVDRFSHDAHNALLKTLEEPPADAAILLVAEGTALLPETVVSRCRVVTARPLTDAQCEQVTGLGGADAEGSPGRALFIEETKAAAAAEMLLHLMQRRDSDALGQVDKLVRKKPSETSKEQRRRLREVLRVAASRLRPRLPESEPALRMVVEALGSLGQNANPGILFSELALTPWKSGTKT